MPRSRTAQVYYLGLLSLLWVIFLLPTRAEPDESEAKIVLAVHGGAGVIDRDQLTPEREKLYRETLEKALRAGHAVLSRKDGTSLDAVEVAIRVMEDSPLFNAGKGAVFTHEGHNELDASIMEGKNKQAGAVTGVQCLKNPISAARKVMEKSPHVLLVGRGAERFAAEHNLQAVEPSYFYTLGRWEQLQKALKSEKKKGDGSGAAPASFKDYFGTVGAVALDREGNLAAGTSTGGMTNKRFNRVGDSPIIGAGTYADNSTCAVSGTGHGEVFIRFAEAHDVAARMSYARKSVALAARETIEQLPKEPGGVGGVIALDAMGHCAFAFNTPGMYRGTIASDGKVHIAIFEK